MVESSFFSKAETFLRIGAQPVVNRFLVESSEGKWHPNGFAVFHLGDVDGLGHMRLHIWPRGSRIALAGQPAIHSHPWELCSLVIAGCYRDILYQAKEDANGPDRLRGFNVRFGTGSEGDRVCPLPVWYELTVTEERSIGQGAIHKIAAGVLHETLVARDEFVSTLLITGKTVDLSKLLLIGDGSFPEQSYVRPAVSEKRIRQMKEDLAHTLAEQLA